MAATQSPIASGWSIDHDAAAASYRDNGVAQAAANRPSLALPGGLHRLLIAEQAQRALTLGQIKPGQLASCIGHFHQLCQEAVGGAA